MRRKLTDKLKKYIRENYRSLKKSDFAGDALAYLNRVKGAAKGRKAQRDGKAIIEGLKIPKDSSAYQLIFALAKAKGVSVRTLIKKYRQEIEPLLESGGIVIQRETDYLIKDLNSLKKGTLVFVNDGDGYSKLSKEQAILRLQMLLMHCAALTNIFMLIYRVEYKLDGDIKFYCPEEKKYKNIILEESIKEFLDNYEPEIIYIESNRKGAA